MAGNFNRACLYRFTSPLSILAVVFFVNQYAAGVPAPQESDRRIDFIREIQPIFSESCAGCHGPQKQMARLRLDSKQAAFAGGVSGPVLIPGNGKESLLYLRVAGLEDLEQMPQKGKKLTADQIELIRTWIDQGAEWPDRTGVEVSEQKRHWSYVEPARPDPPAVRNSSWVRNPIDRFILVRLEQEGITPAPEASRATLIRRVSLDLIGLPPSIEELEAFLSDRSPDAYEKVVDRLLASPRYGERWARAWLDLARYADTHGYEKDRSRSMWLYRDWVIRALNQDMPFNQFTIEQIAGDLLPNATVEQKIASGFNRNTMINEEGGVDAEEFRVAAIIDRVDTVASVWLGTTLACAQCHNHKYDPFSQEEYYRLFSFFNNTEEEVFTEGQGKGQSRGAFVELPSPAYLASHRREQEDEILRLEEVLRTQTKELDVAQSEWEGEMRASQIGWTVLDPVSFASAGGATLQKLDDRSILAGGKNPERDTLVVSAQTDLQDIRAVQLEALTHPALPLGGSSRSPNGNFALTSFEVEAAPIEQEGTSQPIAFSSAAADYSQKGWNIEDALDPDAEKGWAIDGDKEEFRTPRRAVFEAEKPLGFEGGTKLVVRLRHESNLPQHVIGHFRLSVTTSKEAGKRINFPPALEPVLTLPTAKRTEEQKKKLADFYRSVAPLLEPVRERLRLARELWDQMTSPSVLVMKETEKTRATNIYLRGNFLEKGKEVAPGVPAVLHSLPQGDPPSRLTLAKWLVSENNPLVARVTVNRAWMEFFGRGLVNTPEDFGSRGDLPTHPELLDWLATEFRRQRWSMKALHRLIVTSAAYRQTSDVSPGLLERDPYNKLIARGPRFRLEAEMIRDNALAIARLLSSKMYGPSVFPPQPDGIWNLAYNKDKWQTSNGEDRYRRGIYTFWRRTAPYPTFVTFDAPSRERTCLARVRTNTPLQSLATLNDPAFFDAARGLARRAMTEARSEVKARITYAFQLCVSRRPEEGEVNHLLEFFNQELRHFRQDLDAAKKIAAGGDVQPLGSADLAEFAAWTILANVLLNLDETLTKG